MNILIIVNWYPPDLQVAARRWGNLVANLKELGVASSVICVGKGNLNRHVGTYGEQIFRFISTEHPSFANNTIPVQKRTSYISSLKRWFLKFLPDYLINKYLRKWDLSNKSSNEITNLAQTSDFIISSYGEWNAFITGWQMARKSGKPWIADIRDSFELKTGYNKPYLVRLMDRHLVSRLLKRAALRLTIGEKLSDYLSSQYHVKFHSIYNGWVPEDVLTMSSKDSGNEKYLYYAGMIYEHQLPALFVLLTAMSNFTELRLKVRLLKDSSKQGLNDWIEKNNFEKIIEILPPISKEEVKKETTQAVGIIVLEDIISNSKARKGTVTGKLMSLLVSGKPGIAIASKDGEIANLTKKAEGWYFADNENDCYYAINEILSDKKNIDNCSILTEYSMKEQSKKLLELLNLIEKS
jgi:glycosyltransferase involved in cell wall biosynthesis